jgi:hypothetical protein
MCTWVWTRAWDSPTDAEANDSSVDLLRCRPIVIGIGVVESQPPVNRPRGEVGSVDLEIADASALLSCTIQQLPAQFACPAVVACFARSENVVYADHVGFGRSLAAGEDRTFARPSQHPAFERNGRQLEPLSVRLLLRQRRGPTRCRLTPGGSVSLVSVLRSSLIMTRVSSKARKPVTSSQESSFCGSDMGVMRKMSGSRASSNTCWQSVSFSCNERRPCATAFTHRARLALPGQKRTSHPSSQRCWGGALALRPASSTRDSSVIGNAVRI